MAKINAHMKLGGMGTYAMISYWSGTVFAHMVSMILTSDLRINVASTAYHQCTYQVRGLLTYRLECILEYKVTVTLTFDSLTRKR